MADLAALTAAVEAGNRTVAAAETRAAIDEGLDPKTILDAMTAAMDVVGRKFQEGELFVPEADGFAPDAGSAVDLARGLLAG
jgi:methanogenic corrinoid protein MtbC1